MLLVFVSSSNSLNSLPFLSPKFLSIPIETSKKTERKTDPDKENEKRREFFKRNSF
jgi:hypothetical protein